jgi:glutamyl/glutaminyl-tRNA synthetase
MEISHVIRGEDHLSNTPKHILLFRALGAEVPVFAHLPLILNADRTKMSKRKSQTALADYRAQGFVREALVNFLALLGWSSGSEEEIFTLDDLVERFDLARVQSGGAVFDRERLEWLNGQWLRRLDEDDLVERALPFLVARIEDAQASGVPARIPTADDVRPLMPMVRERIPTLAAIGDMLDFVFLDEIRVDPAQLVPKRWDRETTLEALTAARSVIAKVGEVSFEADELEGPLRRLAEERGWKAGDLFMAIRVAVTGRTATPPLFDTLVALGHERALQRLDAAREALEVLAG